jgi:hypothetical protein
MIIVKVLSSLPCSDEGINSDLARRVTISFRMCCGDALFGKHIPFLRGLYDNLPSPEPIFFSVRIHILIDRIAISFHEFG